MKKGAIFLINIYKKQISPMFEHMGVTCKYYPTCSEYAKQSIIEYGVFKGLYLGTKRILRCNPFSQGGYDPVNKGGS
ncbi:MAG: membrane protein insertion efficiency factor YidD [Oscillospiraceae bacterium]|nr:membrane protein insertion efficiency factor YidD [Oscillospiraceae bacterium]